MHITVNGQSMDIDKEMNLLMLLTHLEFDPSVVVIERNGHIVPAHSFEKTLLEHDDILEILHFVGGG